MNNIFRTLVNVNWKRRNFKVKSGLVTCEKIRLASRLGFVGSEEDHVDEGDEDGGGAAFGVDKGVGDRVGVVLGPLDEHQQRQVPEQRAHEQNLGDELRVGVQGFSEN